jgi:hypothetical protein
MASDTDIIEQDFENHWICSLNAHVRTPSHDSRHCGWLVLLARPASSVAAAQVQVCPLLVWLIECNASLLDTDMA